jgi:outer membrane translocation and assembly module TamA
MLRSASNPPQSSSQLTRRPTFLGQALRPLTTAAAAAVLMGLASSSLAQESREGQLAAAQADKASRLRTYEPSSLEQRISQVERIDAMLFGKAGSPVYAFVGSTFDGGGLAAGPGYRARFGDTAMFDAHAAWSIRNYKVADAVLRLPSMAHDRVTFDVRANWLDAPSVSFFGTGNDSQQVAKTTYAYRSTTVGVSARVQATSAVALGGGVDALRLETEPAKSTSTTAALDPSYARSFVFAQYDTRMAPGYTRHGSFYRADLSDYRQVNAGSSSFQRLDVEAQHFIPVLRENWVIAMRALASTTMTPSGEEVPYFLMPDLGGTHTLRGYSAWRFRDRNRMLFTGEYRWTAGPLVDMAIFLDAGKVASRARDLDLGGLKKTYGLGVSVHTPVATVTRLEVARSSEGTSLVLSFGPSF